MEITSTSKLIQHCQTSCLVQEELTLLILSLPSPWGPTCPHRRTRGFNITVGSKESQRAFVCVLAGVFIAATLLKGAEANTNRIPNPTALSRGREKAGLGNGDQWGSSRGVERG